MSPKPEPEEKIPETRGDLTEEQAEALEDLMAYVDIKNDRYSSYRLSDMDLLALQAFGLAPKNGQPDGYTSDIPSTYGDLNATQRDSLATLFASNGSASFGYDVLLADKSYDELLADGTIRALLDKGYASSYRELYNWFAYYKPRGDGEESLRAMAYRTLYARSQKAMLENPEQELSSAEVEGLKWWGLVPQ